MRMAAGTDFSHSYTNIEGVYGNESSEVSVMKDEMSDNSTLIGKPPEHLSAVRHPDTLSPMMSPTELSSENVIERSNGVAESDEHVLNFLDSMDSYLILMDSISSALRQGWLQLASARYSMGTSRVNTTLLDLKPHSAPTKLRIENAETNTVAPRFMLCKWASPEDSEKFSEEAKFEEDDLLQNKSNSSLVQHQEVQERRAEGCESPVSADDHAEKARFRSLSMFGTLVSPKLRATQLSFETALEMLVEISNIRASMLCAYDQVQKDQYGAK